MIRAAAATTYWPMTSRDFSHWRWSEALSMLDRAERLHRLPLADPCAPLTLAGKSLADGVLTLTFRKKEGA